MEEFADLKDYPDVDPDSIVFPEETWIAYAVCRTECGNAEFIVDGQTQVCDRCYDQLFRTEVRKYDLTDDPCSEFDQSMQRPVPAAVHELTGFDYETTFDPQIDPNMEFPPVIYLTYAFCRTDCGNRIEIVEGSTDICEYCGHHMRHTLVRKYKLSEDQSR